MYLLAANIEVHRRQLVLSSCDLFLFFFWLSNKPQCPLTLSFFLYSTNTSYLFCCVLHLHFDFPITANFSTFLIQSFILFLFLLIMVIALFTVRHRLVSPKLLVLLVLDLMWSLLQ